MKRPKILVVGSFVMDQIASTKIIPQAGETVLGKSFTKAPGGKGANQAVQMARLGADVTMVGKLGKDSNGQELLQACKNAGVHTDRVLYDEKANSGCAVILLQETETGTENRILVIPGANMTMTTEETAFLETEISDYDMVVLQLEIPMEVNVAVAGIAKAHNVPVMLNSAPSAPLPDALLECLTFISPNEHEAESLTGCVISREGCGADLDAVHSAAESLFRKGVSNVLITLGSAGASLYDGVRHLYCPAAENVCAVDPTAAGDSFIGAFCYAVCSGADAYSAMMFANQTAAITVSGMGAMPSLPTLEQVEEQYHVQYRWE